MKNVLILGAGSYVGEHLKNWLLAKGDDYRVHVADMQAPDWRQHIRDWDSVVLVAGIVHQKEREETIPLYYKVNRDMAAEAAKLSKKAGARQFVFLSSMSVYGLEQGEIDQDTPLAPKTHYGKSKLAAEALLRAQEGADFSVAVLRPPMVFGPGCRGNYPRLSALARKIPFFPRFAGQRSMIYIDHLSEAIRRIIDSGEGGCFFPQDREYYNVGWLVKKIRSCHGGKMALIPGFGWALKGLSRRVNLFAKVFGSLTYKQSLPGAPGEYRLYTNDRAVEMTEAGEEG